MKEQSKFDKYKGIIYCPWCNAKEFVEKGASGKVTHKCRCNRIIESDYDRMTARLIEPIRGGAKFLTAASLSK